MKSLGKVGDFNLKKTQNLRIGKNEGILGKAWEFQGSFLEFGIW